MLKAPLYYGAAAGEKIPDALKRSSSEYERILGLGYEIDVDLNIAHNYLIVGYDKTDRANPVFFVKDSYNPPGTRCIDRCDRVPYATLMGMVDEANYITDVRVPAAFPELAFLGSWNLDFDGFRGRLDIYHIPGITVPQLLTREGGSGIADKRIGVFYDSRGSAYRVNGQISGNRIIFYLDIGTPNQRWDELRGRRFIYYLDPSQNIMSGFHTDPDGHSFGGYALKSNYFTHGAADPYIDRLVNNDWNMKWGNKTGSIRFVVGEDGAHTSGVFNYGTGSERVAVTYAPGDPTTVKITMGGLTATAKFLNHEAGILCGNTGSGQIFLLYKR